LLLPAFDGLLVALDGTTFWLLVAPSQAVHQPSDVIAVVAHLKLPLDQLGNAGGGPEVGAVAVCQRTVEQQLDQTLSLSGAELRRTTRRKLDLEGLIPTALVGVAPAHDRAGVAADAAGCLVEREPLLQQG